MSQTTIASPQTFSPAYNPLKFIIDSTNKNNTGFKYIFQVFESGTANKIGEYKMLPRIGDGYGEQDLSKLLQTQVSWDLNTLSTSWYNAPNSRYIYDLSVGEEQLAEYSWTANLTDNGGNTRVPATNTFAVGDQVVITQDDGGVANPQLEGLHTVLSVTGSNFTVNVAFTTITDITINGNVHYADNRKLISLGIKIFKNYVAFNGAFRWLDWSVYDNSDYNLSYDQREWLTNQPQQFSCTLGQDLYLNLRSPKGHDKIMFVNNLGDSFYKDINNADEISQVPVGPNNYGILVGTGDLITNTVEWYDVWYRAASGVGSLKYRINLDRRTTISEYHMLFLDRLGSYSSFAFQLKSYERGEVTREIFNRDVEGYVSGAEWNYRTEDMGFMQNNINVSKSFDLNTNWMDEAAGQYFEELITSPQTFVKIVQYNTTEGGIPIIGEDGCPVHIAESTAYQPCIVQNNAYEVFKQRNKNLIKQSITIKLSNQDNVNG
tara:strand:+ start:47 stop:1516 length:1470 start_codon:yes stop_codon:yes gene_type:complete